MEASEYSLVSDFSTVREATSLLGRGLYLSLCPNQHHAFKSEVQLHVFLMSALYGGQSSASNPGIIIPGMN
jgi:hypothetical protein